MGVVIHKALSLALFLLAAACFAHAQTSAALRAKYGEPQMTEWKNNRPAVERFLVRLNIQMTICYTDGGDPCEARLDPVPNSKRRPDGLEGDYMSTAEVLKLINEILPVEKRGKRLGEGSFNGGDPEMKLHHPGCVGWYRAYFENATVSATSWCWGGTAVATIHWGKTPCPDSYRLNAIASGKKPFPPEFPSSEAGEKAELEMYGMATQIGIVARRTIRDRSGRIAREVYYGGPTNNGLGPSDEKDLGVQYIEVYFYDASKRVDHVERWEAGKRLPSVEHNAYDAAGELVRKWFVETDGVRRYETRFRDQSTFAELYFDDTGTYLTSLRWHLVNDIDLPHGWGKVGGGMACGITLSTERGPFDKFELWVNIKNVVEKYLMIDNLVEPSFELSDAWGKIIPLKNPRGPQDRPYLTGQSLDLDEAGFMYPAYKLGNYFDPLPPGKYTIRIQQPVPERNVILVSNAVTFVVQ
jgi:hypothetical protein